MIKKNILFLIFITLSIVIKAQVSITQATGWLESAYIKWDPVTGADSYNVYYTGGGFTDKKIDTQLIRSYGTYFRADILGLTAGNYTIKVAPVISGVEGTASISPTVTVLAQDRNGFAFNNAVPGAYNTNGTLKPNAVVIYITENSKNTISLNVTGATTNPCVGLQNILDGFKKGSDNRPLVVRLIGKITDLTYMLNGDIVIENNNSAAGSITFEGVGSDAVAYGWGLRIKNASNIEVRNIGFMLTDASEGDDVGLQQANDHIWVHNCDLFYGAPGSAADQIKGDGAMDVKKSTYVTLSYNHFWDNGKSNLLGLSENTTTGLYVTYHHNWYDHSDSRHPRVRFYSAHVYNNYYDGNSKYGIGSTEGSSVFVEGNYFRNCKYPMLTSMQGTDIYGGNTGTFSGENGGTIKAFNNYMEGQTRFVGYDATNFPIEFDAYVATTRNEQIPSTIKSKLGAKTYNNFDTNASLYINSLVIEDPSTAKNNVTMYSGRVSGGDLTYTFNNAVDDVSYDVNTALKSLLTNYKTSLVFVQGENAATASTQTLIIPNNNDQIVALGSAITPMVFSWGGTASDVTITGLPAAGISFVKDTANKTITVSGTPTSGVSFTLNTTGTTGTSVSGTGNITIENTSTSLGDQIHNFTSDGINNSFYTISGNLSTTKGTVTYEGLTLTQCLKIETATNIAYTTTQPSTLTLVFVESAPTIKVDGVSYTGSNGIISIPVAAGSHTITKLNTANLFYMKTVYTASNLSVGNLPSNSKIIVFPNPVINNLNIKLENGTEIKELKIFNLEGKLLKSYKGNTLTINLENLNSGVYLINLVTNKDSQSFKFIKK